MLHLGRLRLLRELSERGTIAAVADALQFTPSAVSQQLAMLEREAGVPLLERAGRGVRLTDAALVLVDARRGAARTRRASPRPSWRPRPAPSPAAARIAGFESVLLRLALPAIEPARVRGTGGCAARSSRPSPSRRFPALALGDIDLVIGDEWQHQPRAPPGRRRRAIELFDDPVRLVLAPRAIRRDARLADARGRARGPTGDGRPRLGRDDACGCAASTAASSPTSRTAPTTRRSPSALVARGLAVTLLPALALGASTGGVAVRPIAERPVSRMIFAATRAADAARPSTQALLQAVQSRLRPRRRGAALSA